MPANVLTFSNISAFLCKNTAGLISMKTRSCIPDLVLGDERCLVRNAVTVAESLISMNSGSSGSLLVRYLAIAVFTTENSPSAVSYRILIYSKHKIKNVQPCCAWTVRLCELLEFQTSSPDLCVPSPCQNSRTDSMGGQSKYLYKALIYIGRYKPCG